MTIADDVRARCATIVTEESVFCVAGNVVDDTLEARQKLITEAELCHRLRAGFGLDAILSAQGPNADRDLVLHAGLHEVEVKYFCGVGPVHASEAIKDWRWLQGAARRPPRPTFSRLWVVFFPRASAGYRVPRRVELAVPSGAWLFQQCVSIQPDNRRRSFAGGEFEPFWPLVVVHEHGTVRTGRRGRPRRQGNDRLGFDPALAAGTSELLVEGSRYRVDVIGNPWTAQIWAVVYEPISNPAGAPVVQRFSRAALPAPPGA